MGTQLTRRGALTAALGTALWAASGTPGHADPLTPYLWENRPLLVFTPTMTDTRLLEQRALLVSEIEGLRDRDMVVMAVTPDQVVAELGRAPREDGAAMALRTRFMVVEDAFTLVLIGKDGEAKFARLTPVPPLLLFQIIDAMPMRQREMRDEEPTTLEDRDARLRQTGSPTASS